MYFDHKKIKNKTTMFYIIPKNQIGFEGGDEEICFTLFKLQKSD